MGVSKKNRPCECGSGKKYKQCCRKKNIEKNKKKPRHQAVSMDMGEPVAVTSYRMGPNGLELFAGGESVTPESANQTAFYQRKKNEKVLSRVPIDPSALTLDPVSAFSAFDLITAIDANSVEINGNKVSVACAAICQLVRQADGITAQYGPVEAYEFWNAEGNPETLAWVVHIEHILRSQGFHEGLKVGIVTDSELGNHDQYNARMLALRDTFFLPQNFTLMYGSADSGDGLPNALIKSCDKWATTILDKIRNDDGVPELQAASGKPFSHNRYWGNLGAASFLE